MDEKSFLAKRNIIALILLLLLMVGIFVGVRLARERQQPKSKAAETDPVHFIPSDKVTFTPQGQSGCNNPGGCYTTTDPTVQVQLRSPLGGPAQ